MNTTTEPTRTITMELTGSCTTLEISIWEFPTGTQGAISSDLEREPFPENPINAAYDAIESLVLAHACNGVDIETVEYRDGIQTAIEALDWNLG